MNKYQKAESRLVKRYIRHMRACGCNMDYKAARRRVRVSKRQVARVAKTIRDSTRHLKYRINEAILSIGAVRESLDLVKETQRISLLGE